MRILEHIAHAGARTGLPWLAAAALLAPGGAVATTVNQSFLPTTIGPGAATQLTYTITANTGAITGAGLSNTLPAGTTVAVARPADSTCGGQLSAAPGASVVTWSDGRLALGESCRIVVFVTSATAGSHTNASFDLNASDGASAFPSRTLTVDAARPGLQRSFSPSSAAPGERVTMTYTFDNSLNASNESPNSFSDVLPTGTRVASPANLATDCPPISPGFPAVLEAEPGGDAVSASQVRVDAGTTCAVTVDIVPSTPGILNFVSALARSGFDDIGHAAGQLAVTASTVSLVQSLPDGTASPGQSVPLRFRLVNASRSADATDVGFSVDLDAALSGLVATGLPLSNICGTGSTLSGSGTVSLSGATLTPASPVCEFEVHVAVPAGATTNQYTIASSTITGDLNAAPFTSPAAATLLEVVPVPQLSQSFGSAVIGAGQNLTITYTLTNTSATASLTDFTLADTYGSDTVVLVTLPPAGSCGAGSSFTVYFPPSNLDPSGLLASGLNLPPGESCTFPVVIAIPIGTGSGRFASVVETAEGTVDAVTVGASVTNDVAQVVSPPALALALADPIVAAGGTTTLRVDLANDSQGQLDADEYPDFSAIGFSLDLNAALAGLGASGLPAGDACGAGSSLSGGGALVLSGGSLAAGQNCSFTVSLDVPPGAASGLYTLTSTQPQAQAFGASATGAAAQAVLQVGGLARSMAFGTTPVAPGDSVTLTYTLRNESQTESATSIGYLHDLSTLGSGYVFDVALPTTPCGAGSSLTLSSANRRLTLANGSLAAGATCSFAVTVQIPGGTALGDLPTTTGSVSTLFNATPLVLPAFQTALRVEDPAQPRDLTPSNLDEPDPDGDGLTTAVEQAAGDANGDGIPDAIQPTVAGLVSPVTGRPVALSVAGGCSAITSFSVAPFHSLSAPDGQGVYPDGIASFTLPCSTATVTLTYPGSNFLPGLVLRKYGPQAPDFAGGDRWYSMPGASINRSARSVTYTLTDGGLGDSTAVDGQIVDPVGLALFPATDIPASGWPMVAMMILGVLALGTMRLRNRPT
ncbi:MAG: hypothetical protein KDH20_00765 [Rhodocyclaceae bacterium]|nr:hypothetical protein [Rhodocyclaceae bacterium]